MRLRYLTQSATTMMVLLLLMIGLTTTSAATGVHSNDPPNNQASIIIAEADIGQMTLDNHTDMITAWAYESANGCNEFTNFMAASGQSSSQMNDPNITKTSELTIDIVSGQHLNLDIDTEDNAIRPHGEDWKSFLRLHTGTITS